MKQIIVPVVLMLFSSCGSAPTSLEPAATLSSETGQFPRSPDPTATPGSTCLHADHIRYAEHLNFCDRDVEGRVKVQIFAYYDKRLGYHTQNLPRNQFKIDHLIPLCMGGGNDQTNLWPQHVSIYTLTDPIEPFLCGLVARGRMKQAEAIQIIREVKQAPETTAARMSQLQKR